MVNSTKGIVVSSARELHKERTNRLMQHRPQHDFRKPLVLLQPVSKADLVGVAKDRDR